MSRQKTTCISGTNHIRKTKHWLSLLEEYDIQTAEGVQKVLKNLLGGTIKEKMKVEVDAYSG